MKAYRYRLPLTKPCVFGDITLHQREGLLLEHENQWGEAAPLPWFSRERLDDVIDEFLAGAKECAFSLAFALDASNRPLTTCAIPINALLQGDADETLTRCRQLARSGCQAVKLKVGRSDDVAADIALTKAVCRTLRSDQRLRLDANRAWDLETAIMFARGASGCSIEYLEEPLREPGLLEAFHQSTGVCYALDETLAEVDTIDAFPHAAALVIKPTILGGRQRIERLATAGKPLVFSACFESGVGIARVAQLAAEFSPETPAGLDTYAFLASDVLTNRLRIQDWHLVVDQPLSVKTEMLEVISR